HAVPGGGGRPGGGPRPSAHRGRHAARGRARSAAGSPAVPPGDRRDGAAAAVYRHSQRLGRRHLHRHATATAPGGAARREVARVVEDGGRWWRLVEVRSVLHHPPEPSPSSTTSTRLAAPLAAA